MIEGVQNTCRVALPTHFIPFPSSPGGQGPHVTPVKGARLSVQATPAKHDI